MATNGWPTHRARARQQRANRVYLRRQARRVRRVQIRNGLRAGAGPTLTPSP